MVSGLGIAIGIAFTFGIGIYANLSGKRRRNKTREELKKYADELGLLFKDEKVYYFQHTIALAEGYYKTFKAGIKCIDSHNNEFPTTEIQLVCHNPGGGKFEVKPISLNRIQGLSDEIISQDAEKEFAESFEIEGPHARFNEIVFSEVECEILLKFWKTHNKTGKIELKGNRICYIEPGHFSSPHPQQRYDAMFEVLSKLSEKIGSLVWERGEPQSLWE